MVTAPRQIVPLRAPSDFEAMAAPNQVGPVAHLTYHNGHLLTSVQVVTIFWGAAWNQPTQAGLITQINQFFDFILTSSLLDLLAEYSVAGQPIGRGSRIGTATITATEPGGGNGQVTDGQIQQALQGWIANNTVPQTTANTLYFVYLPPGVTSIFNNSQSCSAFCGYHEQINGTIFYAVEPFITCNGCVFGQTIDSLTKVSSHELCEAITDPALNAWWDDNGGNEIGDICNSGTALLGGYTIQTEWSNMANACLTGPALVSPRVPAGAQVNAVSRSADKLDIFLADNNGAVFSAAWEPANTNGWHGWWWLNGGRAIPGAPVHAVSRSLDKLDIFVIGTDQRVYTAAWEPDFADGWHGWWQLNGGVAAPGANVTVVSRSQDKLDVFVVGTDNRVYTAAWEAGPNGWQGWWQLGNIQVPAGAMVSAVSRSQDKLDIFVTDVNGVIQTAAWEPDFADGWHGWWELNGGRAAPGAAVTAVSRSTDKLDVFVVGTDGHVYTAAWEPDFPDGWHGWWSLGNILVPGGAMIGSISRSQDKLDIFATDVNGVIQTAAWEPASNGWQGWWELNGGRAAPGAAVCAVSRSQDKLDVFVIGTDGRVWTAAWQPDFADWWHGWWAIGV